MKFCWLYLKLGCTYKLWSQERWAHSLFHAMLDITVNMTVTHHPHCQNFMPFSFWDCRIYCHFLVLTLYDSNLIINPFLLTNLTLLGRIGLLWHFVQLYTSDHNFMEDNNYVAALQPNVVRKMKLVAPQPLFMLSWKTGSDWW